MRELRGKRWNERENLNGGGCFISLCGSFLFGRKVFNYCP